MKRVIMSQVLTLGMVAVINMAVYAADPVDQPIAVPTRGEVEKAMQEATRFMVEEVAVNGGYVWYYLADFSRRWGEMEANPSMIWTQAPGTPAMGQVFLDAYHATGNETFYQAAAKAADALIAGQHPSGGWNYVIDFDGEDSLRDWYETIGRNGWRLEEFQNYYGNATFDDHVTVESAGFLLRIYLEKREPRFRAALDKATGFVLNSQYPSGGWPQRYPPAAAWSKQGHPDYTGYITLNDDVAEQNIDFLLLVLQHLKDERVREPIQQAMDIYPKLQQAPPTPGWALQYTTDLEPAAARTYEPRAVSPHTTASAVEALMKFYELTGERKYLKPVPAAIEWLERMEAPAEAQLPGGRNYYRYVEIGTNRFLGVHRRGSNAQNGEYYVDYDMSDQRAERRVDTPALRQRYERLAAMPPDTVTRDSVLFGQGSTQLPKFLMAEALGTDLRVDGRRASELVAALNEKGYWPTEILFTSHPYQGPGPATPPEGYVDHGHSGRVGDAWDTSPFNLESGPMGISTRTFIINMSLLIRYLETQKDSA